MEFLLDPNVAYLFLMTGLLLTLLAIVTPGTGLLEMGALFCLVVAGYAAYNLSINLWALIVMGVSLVPFLFAIRQPKRGILLAVSLVLLVGGSVFLYARENGLPAVNPVIAGVVSLFMIGFLWVMVGKSIEAMLKRPSHDLGTLLGQIGEARTDIQSEGSVQVNGEMWSAQSSELIPTGSRVRILSRNGFVLVVERVQTKS